MGEIVEILCLTTYKTQYYVQSMVFMMKMMKFRKNAIAFTADEPKIWGK